jgi:hypothetical protein
MGSTNFFSKLASVDPLAQALNLPGAHKYAQSQAQDAAGQTDTNGGAYTGINASLAGANAGYAPGGPGSTVGFAPTQPTAENSILGHMQGAANLSGNLTPQPWATGSLKPFTQAAPTAGTGNSFVQPSQTQNPYMLAARGAAASAQTPQTPQNNQGGLW